MHLPKKIAEFLFVFNSMIQMQKDFSFYLLDFQYLLVHESLFWVGNGQLWNNIRRCMPVVEPKYFKKIKLDKKVPTFLKK
jgi:hypothetical protein